MKSLLWIQGATCNGNTHSFLNYPPLKELLQNFDLLYHPTLPSRLKLREIADVQSCDILVVEGAPVEGFKRGGMDMARVIAQLFEKSAHVVCVGSCAVYGGLFGERGVALRGEEPTKLFDPKVINVPGCPAHPEWIGAVLWALAQGQDLLLDSLLRPKEIFAYTVHAGCTRNEYFEWKVDAKGFGQKEGCLFYEQGCQGPFTHGSCNKILWNGESSKPRVGTPCFGCTEPTFAKEGLYRTKTYMGIPANFPLGVPKRAYLTITGVAKSFRIERLMRRLFED